ncbi:MAG: hypothetical protein EBY20_04000 [Alphaproteobacteria bacterium]|nr:hypothetical protein [Alphaproteobacteria bacterium]
MEFLKLQESQNAEFWAEYRRQLWADYLANVGERAERVANIAEVINEEVEATRRRAEEAEGYEELQRMLEEEIEEEERQAWEELEALLAEDAEPFQIYYELDYTTINGALRNARYRQLNRRDIIPYANFIDNIFYFVDEIGVEDTRGVVVLFTDSRGQSYFRTIKAGGDKFEFELQLGVLGLGIPLVGSDEVPDTYYLDTSTFFIKYISHPTAASKNTSYRATDLKYYKIADYKGDDGDCLLNVLRNVRALEKNLYNKNIRKLLELPDGKILCNPANLQKLANLFKVNIEAYSEDIEEVEPIKFIDDPKNGNKAHYEMRHAMLYNIKCDAKGTKPTAHILIKNNHCSHILKFKDIQICPYTGDLEIRNNEKDLKKRVLEQFRPYYGCKRIAEKKEKEKKKYNIKILVYDIETIFEVVKGVLMPYAVGWYIFDVNREDADFSKEEAKMAFGFDCMNELVKEIGLADENTKYIITSFNGARFDNFILARALASKEKLNDVFFTSNQIRDIRTGNHHTLDLCKLCPMELKEACKGFQTSPAKVEGFDHSLPQREYMSGDFDAWIRDNKLELDKYLSCDVLCTCSLAVKLIKNLKAITGINPFIEGIGTIASLSWTAFQNHIFLKEKETREECAPKAAKDEETDIFIRKGIIGGRTQNFEHAGYMTNDEDLYMIDEVSLYPSAMSGANSEYMPESILYGYYPVGEEVKTESYMPGYLGIYNVKIIEQPIPNIIPLREKGKPHNWAYRGEIITIISNVSIELIRHHGGSVEVYDGIYYPKKSNTMFKSFLEPIIKIKSKEDENKEKKRPEYNKALRETAKLIMNSLSGKPAQKNYDDLAILCKGALNQISAEKKFLEGKAPKWYEISGETCLLVGKKEFKYNQKKAMPVALSVFIYEHSRSQMYQLIYSKYNPIYTDTDSAILRKKDYMKFREDFPSLNPEGRIKVLGDLECELFPCEGQKMVICQPKCYYINGLDDEGKPTLKAKIKGLSYKRDKYIKTKEKAKEIENYDLAALHNLYNGEQVDEEIEKLSDPYNLFKDLAQNKSVSVLCSSLRKGVDPECGFMIKQVYQIKTLILDKEAREEIKQKNKDLKLEIKRINKELLKKILVTA